MKKHLKTNFRQFILERINNDAKQEDEIEEIDPDDDLDFDDEPIEDEDEYDFTELDDDDESQSDDDLIEELHKKYKKMKRIYEHCLYQRKRR